MKELTGLNGVLRNLAKLWNEALLVKQAIVVSWARFREEKDGHSYVDLFVEPIRASAYFFGHLIAVLLAVYVVGSAIALAAMMMGWPRAGYVIAIVVAIVVVWRWRSA